MIPGRLAELFRANYSGPVAASQVRRALRFSIVTSPMLIDDIFTSLPELETERLFLREIAPEEAEMLFDGISEPDVIRYLHYTRMGRISGENMNEGADIEPFGLHHLSPWGMIRKEKGDLIGSCIFHSWYFRHSRAELGVAVIPSCRHQGYTAEVLRVAIEFGFIRMELNRIEASYQAGNRWAQRSLEAAGMPAEMLLRQHTQIAGILYDMQLHVLLAEEWARRR